MFILPVPLVFQEHHPFLYSHVAQTLHYRCAVSLCRRKTVFFTCSCNISGALPVPVQLGSPDTTDALYARVGERLFILHVPVIFQEHYQFLYSLVAQTLQMRCTPVQEKDFVYFTCSCNISGALPVPVLRGSPDTTDAL